MRLRGLLPHAKRSAEPSQPVPADGTYMTDGSSLFRVAGTLLDINDDMLVELEDCRTLELSLLPASRASGLGLRAVGAARRAGSASAPDGGSFLRVPGATSR